MTLCNKQTKIEIFTLVALIQNANINHSKKVTSKLILNRRKTVYVTSEVCNLFCSWANFKLFENFVGKLEFVIHIVSM